MKKATHSKKQPYYEVTWQLDGRTITARYFPKAYAERNVAYLIEHGYGPVTIEEK